MKQFSKPGLLAAAITAAISVGPASAWAQLEEVIVTAQKRSESMQDVPIAMNAVVGEKLDSLGIQDTDDLMKLFSNVSLQGNSSINSGVTIRGVGTANWHITAQQAVGQYLDEVSLFSPYTSQLSVFDMERIEVLRGPQNTLFGRNTTGGAVNYISRKPSLDGEIEGYILSNVGNEGKLDVEGAVSIPLGDNVAMRVSGQSVERDAIFDNLWDGSEMGDIDRKSARVHLLMAPSDRTEILLSGHVGYNRSGVTPLLNVGFFDPDGSNVTPDGKIIDPNAPPDCPSVLKGGSGQFDRPSNCLATIPAWVAGPGGSTNPSTGDWHKTYSAAPDKADVDFEGAFLKISHDFDSFSLTSITSYDELSIDYNQDNGGTASGQSFKPGQSGQQEVFGQDIRLASLDDGPFRWIAGAYYSKEEGELATIIYRTDPGGAPFGIVPSVTIDQDVEILSGYGKLDFDLSDRMTLSVGLRYTQDEKEGDSLARVFAKTDTGLPSGVPDPVNAYWSLDHINSLPNQLVNKNTPVEQDLDEWGGNVSLSYSVNDDVMVYASYGRGFKSGAFDTRALAALQPNSTADEPTGPEFLDAYEVGFKSTLADGNLILNGAIYYYEWEDLQAFGVDPTGGVAFVNLPETELKGFELEMQWAATDSLYIQGGIGYNDSELVDVGGQNAREGAPMSGAPEWSVTGLATQSFRIGENELILQGDFKWQDEFTGDLIGRAPTTVEEITLVNVRATYIFGDEDQYEAALWAENITEEKYCLNLSDIGSLTNMQNCLPNAGMAFYGANLRVSF